MDLDEAGQSFRFLIRDHDGKFTVLRPLATAAVLRRTRPQTSDVTHRPLTGGTFTGRNAKGMNSISSHAPSDLHLVAADRGLKRLDAR